jgi:hypothetical protein
LAKPARRLAQITSVEQEITKLAAERDTLRDLLFRVRRENSTLRDVTRKNSFERILIENRILNILKAASKPVKSQRLWWAAQEISPRLRYPVAVPFCSLFAGVCVVRACNKEPQALRAAARRV